MGHYGNPWLHHNRCKRPGMERQCWQAGIGANQAGGRYHVYDFGNIVIDLDALGGNDYEITSAEPVLRLVYPGGHASAISSAEFSDDGRYVLTGSYDGTARLWEVETGKEIQVFAGKFELSFLNGPNVSISHGGKRIMTDDFDAFRVWDTASGSEIQLFKGSLELNSSAVLSPDGHLLLTRNVGLFNLEYDPSRACIWDVSSGHKLHILSGHSEYIEFLNFDADGKWALTGEPGLADPAFPLETNPRHPGDAGSVTIPERHLKNEGSVWSGKEGAVRSEFPLRNQGFFWPEFTAAHLPTQRFPEAPDSSETTSLRIGIIFSYSFR